MTCCTVLNQMQACIIKEIMHTCKAKIEPINYCILVSHVWLKEATHTYFRKARSALPGNRPITHYRQSSIF